MQRVTSQTLRSSGLLQFQILWEKGIASLQIPSDPVALYAYADYSSDAFSEAYYARALSSGLSA